MIKVGIVDLYLNNFHANKFTDAMHGYLADQGAKVVTAWEAEPRGEDWCEKHNVERASSPEEVAEKADAIMVLSPDDIIEHRRLAEPVLSYGKPTLIDKFLAPTLEDARAIVKMAEKYNTPIYSASSLRYLDTMLPVLEKMSEKPTDMFVQGMGNWPIYGIHTVAVALRAMGSDIKRISDTGSSKAHLVTLDYGDDRRAIIEVRDSEDGYEKFPWYYGIKEGNRYHTGQAKDFDALYDNMIRTAINFFKTGKSDMTLKDVFAHVAVLETAAQSFEQGGIWLDMPL